MVVKSVMYGGDAASKGTGLILRVLGSATGIASGVSISISVSAWA